MDKNSTAPLAMIPLFSVNMPKEVDAPLLEVLHSGYIGQGPKVDEFERLLAAFFANDNVLTLNNGTAALHLAMRLAGVTEGTEVITTPMTCAATNEPILANGGKIIWADVDAQTGLIDPLDVERKITPRTKLIIGVDWGGTPCDWDRLNAIGKKYGVKVLEDAAHAIGATYKGKNVGTLADYTIFSLQAIKHITTVDGGILVCRDSADYRRGKLLRWYGIDRETERKDSRIEEDIQEWGYKFHMNDVTATLGIVQLKRVREILNRHREIATKYFGGLDLSFYQSATPQYEGGYSSSFWLFTVLLPNEFIRSQFVEFMKTKNIMVSQVHARNDVHTTFLPYKNILPGVDEFSSKMICIPVNYKMTDADVKRVVDACREFQNSI